MVDIKAEFQRNPQSVNALKIVQRLHEAGFQAYLVGGCVRDLLLGKSPKDFDVATDAHPDKIRSLFNSARLIGRRFQIVHVRFGREIIEVTTFRAPADDKHSKVTADGMLLSDNVYGTYEQDVMRRDFTMNALYYDPQTNEVRDLVKGREDIEARTIRLIGEPEQRFREDPVRMLRAARFEAKLEFEIEPTARDAIHRVGHLLQEIPPARLFEEALKLFMSGYGEASFNSLNQHKLIGWLFPDCAQTAEGTLQEETQAHALIQLALASTDKRIRDELPVTPAFVLAALLWWPFVNEQKRLKSEGVTSLSASHEAALNVITRQQFSISIPKRFATPMRDIWHLQSRLHNTRGKKPAAIARHKRFRAAYDFLLLREASGENLNNLGEWWTNYQVENPVERTASAPSPRKRRPKTRKRRPRPSP